jgi:hypothetical protein
VADAYYFRLKVTNEGNKAAERVEVFASELRKEQASGTYEKIETFLPMNLKWSHIGTTYRDIISRGMPKHCDLCHIVRPEDRAYLPPENNPRLDVPPNQTLLFFEVEVRPFTMAHILPPGKYQLDILVGAANAEPSKFTIRINHTGKWYDDEAQMFKEGVSLSKVEPF